MKRIERHKLRKQVKKMFIFALIVPFLTIISGIGILLKLGPFEDLLYHVCLLIFIFSGIIIGLSIMFFIILKNDMLLQERNRIVKERKRFHLRRFWNDIQSEQYDEAKKIYNYMLKGGDRVFAHGILIGAFVSGKNRKKQIEGIRRFDEITS